MESPKNQAQIMISCRELWASDSLKVAKGRKLYGLNLSNGTLKTKKGEQYLLTHTEKAAYLPLVRSALFKAIERVKNPVAPGEAMPLVEGCTKQDYAVLIVIGVGVED